MAHSLPWLWIVIFPFLLCTPYHSKAKSLSPDALSLLSFKDSLSADPYKLLAGWTNRSFTNHCYWRGVACDGQRVTALNLTGLILRGTLTSSIGDLSGLRILSLSNNALSGQIPESIGKLRLLEVLELQGNNFSGRIPSQISYLLCLRLLNLSYNAFFGHIPDGLIGSGNLRVVDLSNNELSGTFVLGNRSSKCDSLRHLKLSHNFLTGEIPSEIRKCRNLRTLLVDGNILEGRIPPEIGHLKELRVLDVSRNSLTERIPKELSNCPKLSVLVLTDLAEDPHLPSADQSLVDISRGEFNAFVGGIPSEVLLLSSLQILWAPRANLGGRLPSGWTNSCSLRVMHLGQNYISGVIPEGLGLCKNITFLDLSSNNLIGYFPRHLLTVPCMKYFNISRNIISGVLPGFRKESCEVKSIFFGQDSKFLSVEDFSFAYSNIHVWGTQMKSLNGKGSEESIGISHDFSWNRFIGSINPFSIGDGFFAENSMVAYRLLLNNNKFNGTLPRRGLVSNCNDLESFSVSLSVNQLSGHAFPLNCLRLAEFEASQNQIGGPIDPGIGDMRMLQRLELSGNKLSGSLPAQLGKLKNLKWMLLGENNLTGEIPTQVGNLASLTVMNLSHNGLTGTIPVSLANASNLQTLLLDHNQLHGEIPSSFSSLFTLTRLDVSFNNLSGHIPHLRISSNCESFRGNKYLNSCPDVDSTTPAYLPVPLEVQKWHGRRKLESLIIALVISASVALCILLVIVLVIIYNRNKLGRRTSFKKKVVVTFPNAPTELNYENVVRATGNFSICSLIGTGGFGSTYKAELIPGFLVAVKRLSIGRFQGVQQFDAEIRTLGRIRHKNLVTLMGYYVGEAEMFLIYNYLSGGNLEAFIHDSSGKNVRWPIIHKIAIDIAQALAYLHYSCDPRIVHRDIKPSNILLDDELNAYLSDFGLARLLEVSETHATTDVAGTFGYVAPEYATTCRVTDKSDVYSFGVVLLELMSGRKTLDPSFSDYGDGFNIVPWAKLLIREGRYSEIFSPVLWEVGPKENLLGLLRLAATCTVETLSIRPSMKQVLEKLKQLKQ